MTRPAATLPLAPGKRIVRAEALYQFAAPADHPTAMLQIFDSHRRQETIVVVPCFNEARRLDVSAYDEFLRGSADVTLLFVDDGSTDDTPLILEQLRQQHPRQVCTLRLASNVGKAEAVRRGVRVALRRRPEIIGYWDADLATPLDAIPQLCNVLRARDEVSLVMGSRVALLGRRIRRRGIRHMLGRMFATAASLVLGLPVYDTQCGAKLFRATPEVAGLFAEPFSARWIFDVEILARMIASAEHVGTMSVSETIYEHPLDRWQDVGGSRLRPLDFVVAATDLVAIYRRYTRGAGRQSVFKTPSSLKMPELGLEHRKAA